MKTMKRLVLLAVVSVVAAGAFVYLERSRNAWQPPFVVKIQSEKDVAPLTASWQIWQTLAEGGEPQGLLLRDGDHFLGGELPIRYLESDGRALTVTFTDWSVRIGDKTVAVKLQQEGKEGGIAWLESATARQLAEVRTLDVGGELDGRALAALKRLAAASPNLDLLGDLPQALPLFQPRAVFAPEKPDATTLTALANQPRIEMLLMNASAAGSLGLLPTLPKLRRLVMNSWDVDKAGPLPAGLNGLKSLVVTGAVGMKDLKALDAAPPGLEELSLIGAQGLTDLSGLEKRTALRTLILRLDKVGDLSSLAGLKQLRWVGLPPGTNQEQFGAFISAHSNLAVLDMSGNESVKDLSPLSALKGLQGLLLGGPYENLNAVHELTSLRFLGISKKVWDASPEQAAAVRKALPDALVVRIEPLCLGSGWIVLLVPVLAAGWLVRRRSRTPVHPA